MGDMIRHTFSPCNPQASGSTHTLPRSPPFTEIHHMLLFLLLNLRIILAQIHSGRGTAEDRIPRPPPHARARNGLLPCLQGPGHPGNTGIYGTQEYSAYGSLHGAVAGQIQELLEGLITTCPIGGYLVRWGAQSGFASYVMKNSCLWVSSSR